MDPADERARRCAKRWRCAARNAASSAVRRFDRAGPGSDCAGTRTADAGDKLVQLVVENDHALARELVAAGAIVMLEMLHYSGPL